MIMAQVIYIFEASIHFHDKKDAGVGYDVQARPIYIEF